MPRFSLNKGDIIAITLEESLFGFAQVVNEYSKKSGGFLMAVFDYKSSTLLDIDIKQVCHSSILFLGFTFDARIFHKYWNIIGNYTENISGIKRPYFKMGIASESMYLIDEDLNIIAAIPLEVFNRLSYKHETAPIRYENALKAYFGLMEWKEDHESKLYRNAVASNEIAQRFL